MKNLLTRTITGLVYIALIIGGIIYGSWAYLLMTIILAVPAVVEFKRLTVDSRESSANTCLDVVATVALLWSAHLFPWHLGLFVVFMLALIARLVVTLYTRDADPLRSFTSSLAALVYVALPIALMQGILLRGGQPMLLGMFVLIWLNDTGAFVVGSTLGRHKLFPRLSPKKSWEGFAGGLLFCVAASCAAHWICPGMFNGLSAAAAAGMGAVVSVMATLGDLIESLLKRAAGVKDSGNLLPGHGGMLDRIDSLLLVAPSVLVYMSFCLI
jgi:phosphatidate cytidylyltransferase